MSYSQNLSEKEKKIFDNAKIVFEELLDDFNKKGLLRKGTPHDQRERLSKMWEQSRQLGKGFNATFKLFDSKEKIETFAARNKDDGITEEVLTGSFLNQTIGLLLYNIETVFRTSLLFFLEEKMGLKKRMELGPLLRAIEGISPSIHAKLKPLIDLELRNGIAHGSFWFESGGKGFLAKDSHLENPKQFNLFDYLVRIKKQNLIAHAFVEVLVDKVNQGYFK